MKKFVVRWWSLFSIAWFTGVMFGTVPLFFNSYVRNLGLPDPVVAIVYAGFTSFLLLGPPLLMVKWSNELERKGPCPQCHDTGFERWFVRMEVRHGGDHQKRIPWMVTERHLGYFLCERCSEPSYARIQDTIRKTKTIKEFLYK